VRKSAAATREKAFHSFLFRQKAPATNRALGHCSERRIALERRQAGGRPKPKLSTPAQTARAGVRRRPACDQRHLPSKSKLLLSQRYSRSVGVGLALSVSPVRRASDIERQLPGELGCRKSQTPTRIR